MKPSRQPAIVLHVVTTAFCVFFGENHGGRRSAGAHLIGSRRLKVEN